VIVFINACLVTLIVQSLVVRHSLRPFRKGKGCMQEVQKYFDTFLMIMKSREGTEAQRG